MSRLRFKHFLRERNEYSTTGGETLLSVSEYYGVKPRSDAFEGDAGESRAASLEGYRIVKPGDLVMNYMLAWKGAYGLSDFEGITSPAYAVFDVDAAKVDQRFLHHRTRSQDMQVEFKARSKGIIESRLRLYPDTFLAMEVEIPDLPTQKRIAAFLDRETARIDELIAKKERLVEVLGEKRQSGIVSAVTFGLNEKVDLKDTGVSWIPQIPKHWELRKIKHIGNPIIGLTYAPDDLVSEGEGTPVLRANNIQAGKLQSANLIYVSSAVSQKLRLREGDILICSRNGSRNLIGKNAMVSSEFSGMTFGAFNTVLRSKYSDFLYWVLQSPIFDHQAGSFLTSTINQLTISTLSNLVVPFAPPEEQEAICKHLCERERIFDAGTKTLSTSIDCLREYRAALITAAVTGQIDVETYSKAGTTSATLDRIEEEMQAP